MMTRGARILHELLSRKLIAEQRAEQYQRDALRFSILLHSALTELAQAHDQDPRRFVNHWLADREWGRGLEDGEP